MRDIQPMINIMIILLVVFVPLGMWKFIEIMDFVTKKALGV